MALVQVSLAGEREKLNMKFNVVVFTFIVIHLTLGRVERFLSLMVWLRD